MRITEHTVPGQYPVKWDIKNHRHVITYGEDIKVFPYREGVLAAERFGHCVLHALQCAGRFRDGQA